MASSTGTLPEEKRPWGQLPEELVLRVLDRRWTRRDSCAVRGTCRRWRSAHDASCKKLRLRNGVTEEVLCSLCGRLPAVTRLHLNLLGAQQPVGAQSLTTVGLHAVGGLNKLTWLNLDDCNVTDKGLQQLTALTALTTLWLVAYLTSEAERDALKAAIPCLTIYYCRRRVERRVRAAPHLVRALSSLPALATLNLLACRKVTAAGVQALRNTTTAPNIHIRQI
jgi:hypothetical protein